MERLSSYTRALGGDTMRDVQLRDLGRVLYSMASCKGFGGEDMTATAHAIYGTEIAALTKAAIGATFGDDDTEFSDFAALSAAFWTSVADSFVGTVIRPRRLPFEQHAMGSIQAASASWVGNGASKPITRAEYAGIALPETKVVATVVVPREAFNIRQRELVEQSLVDEMQDACVRRLNATFCSSAAAVSGESPAGIGVSATPIASTGSSATQIATDIANMIDVPGDAGISIKRGAFFGSSRAKAMLQLPRIAGEDGTLAGLPMYAPAGASGLTLVSADHVALAADERVTIRRSESGTIEMSDDPDSDTGTVVSLFQKNMVALMAETFVSWELFGPGNSQGKFGAATLTGATWV